MAMRPSIFGSAEILKANFGSFTSISSIADPFPGHNQSINSSPAPCETILQVRDHNVKIVSQGLLRMKFGNVESRLFWGNRTKRNFSTLRPFLGDFDQKKTRQDLITVRFTSMAERLGPVFQGG